MAGVDQPFYLKQASEERIISAVAAGLFFDNPRSHQQTPVPSRPPPPKLTKECQLLLFIQQFSSVIIFRMIGMTSSMRRQVSCMYL